MSLLVPHCSPKLCIDVSAQFAVFERDARVNIASLARMPRSGKINATIWHIIGAGEDAVNKAKTFVLVLRGGGG